MRRISSRPGAGQDDTSRLASSSHPHQHRLDFGTQSQSPACCSVAFKDTTSRRRRRPASASAFAATAAILVSSVLVSSPAMIAPVSASYIPSDGRSSSPSPVYQHAFDVGHSASPQPLPVSAIASSKPSSDLLPSATSSSLTSATSQAYHHSTATPADDVDDHLPEHVNDSQLHRQYARQYDDESALFGERDVSMMSRPLQLASETLPDSFHTSKYATTSAQRYSLPSTYPSSIASSWSRPERSVWFQQKAIIITSIFLAIFIVLFIGAAVFLRERKFDDELADLDDEEALARIEERMTMGRFSDPVEKDSDSPGARFKRKFRIGRKRSEKDGTESPEPSSGSSSAVRRKRHLVSRWTRSNNRNSNDTMRGVSDTASIRSGRSARRLALGDPRAPQESVEITYDSEGAELPRTNTETGDTIHTGNGSAGSAHGSSTVNDDNNTSDALANRPRSPPPPHPDSAQQRPDSSSEGRSSSNTDPHGSNMMDADASLRSPRRVLLDDSDFQAADAAEAHHMPPAYISSGSGGLSGPSYDGAALAAAISRGDAKQGIPPPEERDPTVSPEIINAVLRSAPSASRDTYESTGPTAAHVATDDKAVLGALSAAASMPSAPAAADGETSAPAYGAPEQSAAVSGSSSSRAGAAAPAASGPSAPMLEVDGDGFEVAPIEADAVASGSAPGRSVEDEKPGGKGKAKQVQTPSLLPAPPVAVEPAFSPFDQPYRATAPPGASVPPSTPGRGSPLGSRRSTELTSRKSEKQKEAEQEEQLAQLVASRPDAINVPQYERHGPSAPPLAPEAAGGAPLIEEEGIEHLPAYEQRRRSSAAAAQLGFSSPATASAEGARSPAPSAPSAPSAPPMMDDEE